MDKKIAFCVIISLVAVSAHAKEYRLPRYGYQNVIRRTAAMVSDSYAINLAGKYGLQLFDLTWEDTARYKNSSVGPNISDMTIQVQHKNPMTGEACLTCMPVIRYPNFSDKTGDIPLDKFYLLVGNEKGRDLKKVTLRQFLGNLRKYLHNPYSWGGNDISLLVESDTHVLVSAQACFLPIPRQGIAEFNPVIFNYQSYEANPAVLTILASREGTSVTVIDNKRNGFQTGCSRGQRLFLNNNGERAGLTGQRLTDFLIDGENRTRYGANPDESRGLNMVLLIQVPLKQKIPLRYKDEYFCDSIIAEQKCMKACVENSDVENAVIGHGKIEGPFTEIAGLKIERDPKYPIRITVQFYKATSNGIVGEQDMKEIAGQINKVYNQADYAGSLVAGGDTKRPTEYIGDKIEPSDWWEKFWQRRYNNTGEKKDNTWQVFGNLFNNHHKSAPGWGILDEQED